MGQVKSAFEKAMEKIQEIEPLTPDEREAVKERERVKSLLASYYRGGITKDGLWQALKGSKPLLLIETQHMLVDSIRLTSTPEEMNQRRDGILAIEALKEKKNSSAIEQSLNTTEKLQREFLRGKEDAVEQLRAAIEQNPQMRLRPVKTRDGRTVLQPALSVDEAVQTRLAEFLSEHEKRYDGMFAMVIERLKKDMR